MAVNSYQYTRNPLLIAEIVALVIENVATAPDLLNCACVNSMWTVLALKELYRGSVNDMQFRTPGIESLNCLFVASRQRFSRNMSFVKHLLLAAEHVPDANWGAPFGRPMCFDVCRSMRHGDDAERLLLPQPWRLKSLMIPFEIANHYWDCIPDFICQTVKFLAITNSDCTRFMWPHRHNLSTSNFPNLKALTVYISESEPVLSGLVQLLETHKFQLEFLHVEEWEDREPRELARKLMPYLQEQQNLRALALVTDGCGNPPARQEGESRWPKLKALYLRRPNEDWFVQFPKFKELQILTLLPDYEYTMFSGRALAQAVAKCTNLRAITIPSLRIGSIINANQNIQFLRDIARGCPLLQKLSVADVGNKEVKEPLLSDLLGALPRLEFLKLGLVCRIYGTELQDLARYCPRLTFIDLPDAKLYISLAQMIRTLPFRHLEVLRLERIFLEKPRQALRGTNFHTPVIEWNRIFPKVRRKPCEIYWEQPPATRERTEREGAFASSDEEPSFPDTDDDDSYFDWDRAMLKVWRALNYDDYDESTVEQFQYMWETNLEIQTVGWPVVSTDAFIRPRWCSTSAN